MAVRREKVVLELQDSFSAEMLKAAGATATLNRELNQLDGQSVQVDRSTRAAATSLGNLDRSASNAGRSIDRLSGRMGIALDAMLLLGPGALATAAMAVPALTTIASGAGALGIAAGSAAIAFGGVGEALEALNQYQLEPTTENLAALEDQFDKIGPAAEEFVRQLDSMSSIGAEIRRAGADNLFPGLTDALEALEKRGPDAVDIVGKFNRVMGDLARDGARSLAGPEWDDFFRMIERRGPKALDTIGRALGDIAHGASEVLEAFAPLSEDGLDWIGDAAADFDEWATGLKRNDDFKGFVDYIRENGPQVADTLGAIAEAGSAIAQALAPLSGLSLKGIEGLANAVSAVAESDAAPYLLGGFAAYRIGRRIPGVRGMMPSIGGGGLGGGGGVVPVFVTNPGFGGAPGVPGGSPGTKPSTWSRVGRAIPFLGAGLAISEIARNEVNSPDHDPRSGTGGILGGSVGYSIDIPMNVDTELAENKISWVDKEIERLNGTTAKSKLDADQEPAENKISWVDREIERLTGKTSRSKLDAVDLASGVINGVAGALSALDGRTATTTIRTERINITTDLYRRGYDTLGGLQRSADGGSVPKDGGPYGDRYPYLLAPGEEVISNRFGQADRHRDLLKAINAGRLANGGTVGGGRGGGTFAPQVSLAGLTLRANVEGLGDVMFTIADEVVGSYRTHDARQAATVYSGVSDD